jgi:hypothetical protein
VPAAPAGSEHSIYPRRCRWPTSIGSRFASQGRRQSSNV